jgi:hypothetical protein
MSFWNSLLGNASSNLNPSNVQSAEILDNTTKPSHDYTINTNNVDESTQQFGEDNWQELYKGFSKGWGGEGTNLPFNQNLQDYQSSWNTNNPNNQLTADGLYGGGMDNHFRSLQYPDSPQMKNTTGEMVENPLAVAPEEEALAEEASSGLLGAAKKPWKFQSFGYTPFKGF